jgi:hypothetical protein
MGHTNALGQTTELDEKKIILDDICGIKIQSCIINGFCLMAWHISIVFAVNLPPTSPYIECLMNGSFD